MKLLLSIWCGLLMSVSAARLEFKSIANEVHAPADSLTVTSEFSFTNTSSEPVTITKADPGCSCLKAEISGGKLRYAPGESGLIRMVFEIGNYSGTVNKGLALFLDKDPVQMPSIFLTLKIHIPMLITLEPKTVRWDLNEAPNPKSILIQMAPEQTIHLSNVKTTSEQFFHQLKTLEDGKKYELIITPQSTSAPSIGIMRIETDCKISRYKIQQAFAQVTKITSSP